MNWVIASVVWFSAVMFAGRAQYPEPEVVQFQTPDGITIFGDLYHADVDSSAPFILLFHQGGSAARAEYGPLVGRLLDAGYHALAIDQRRGGSTLGGTNRTVAALGDRAFGFCEVYPDLEAALQFVGRRGFSGPRILWGSSYSGALVFQLAARQPEGVAGVLAFSPASGGPLEDCRPEIYSPLVQAPVLVIRPVGEAEIESVRQQLDRFRAEAHQIYVADPGEHGSSVLNENRVGASTEHHWQVVLGFLQRATSRPE